MGDTAIYPVYPSHPTSSLIRDFFLALSNLDADDLADKTAVQKRLFDSLFRLSDEEVDLCAIYEVPDYDLEPPEEDIDSDESASSINTADQNVDDGQQDYSVCTMCSFYGDLYWHACPWAYPHSVYDDDKENWWYLRRNYDD